MRVHKAVLLLMPLLVNACVLSGTPVSPYGRRASVHQKSAAWSTGELIAVSADTIWLMRGSRLMPIANSTIDGVQVQRHDFGGKRTLKWLAIAGLATGAALHLSCSSYYSGGGGSSGNDCYAVIPVTMLFFGAGGGLFGLFNEYSSKHRMSAQETVRLRTFARFPQGMPDSLRRLHRVVGGNP